MAFVIDGSNFLGHSVPGGHRDPEARAALVGRLLAFQRHTRSRILLVFDGPPDERFGDGRLGEKFRVVFPRPGEKADAIIQDTLSGPVDRRRFSVVTSDRELRAFARSRGARVLSCREFELRLKTTLRRGREGRELAKRTEFPTRLETKLWLDLFQGKKK